MPWAGDRYTLAKGDATQLEYEAGSFDSAFLCWVLEHVGDPLRVLSEVRRVLVPGSPVSISEVLNATFFIDPYSPDTLRYWTAFHLDNRDPVERAEFLAYWSDLLLSGAPALLDAKKVEESVVEGMRKELARVARDPNSVFFYAFIQATARSW